MKLPQTFIPEKDLENKVEELTKGFIKSNSEDTAGQDIYISIKSMEVAQRLGKKDTQVCGYIFDDKETGLKVEYYPSIQASDIQLISVEYKGKKVFESSKRDELEEKVFVYTPGVWEREIERIHVKLQHSQ